MSSKRSWYLIFTKPRQENLARENLERQGFTTYLPLTQQSRRRNGKSPMCSILERNNS